MANNTSKRPVMGKMWAIIPIWNHFFCPLRKASPSGECPDQHMQQRSPTPTQSPLTIYVFQAILLCTGASKEFCSMWGASIPWAAHTDSGILCHCRICSLVPTLSQLWHCSISRDRCLCADGSNPYTCCGNQEHAVKVAVLAGPGFHQAAAESPAGKAVPRRAAPPLCLCDMWFAWKYTELIKLLFLAAVSDVSGTTSAPGDQDQAWEQDMGWKEWVGVVSILGLALVEVCSVPIGKGARSGNCRGWWKK